MKTVIAIGCLLSGLVLGWAKPAHAAAYQVAQVTHPSWQFFPSGIQYKTLYSSNYCKKPFTAIRRSDLKTKPKPDNFTARKGMTYAIVTLNVTNVSPETMHIEDAAIESITMASQQKPPHSLYCVDYGDIMPDELFLGANRRRYLRLLFEANQTRYIRLLFEVPNHYNPEYLILPGDQPRLPLYN
jgi:hypothetical protein